MIANYGNPPRKPSASAVILIALLVFAFLTDGRSAYGQRTQGAGLEITEQQAGERVMRFPRYRSLGTLWAQDRAIEESSDPDDWEYLAPAMGDVIAPAGKRLWLVTHSPSALTDLSPLLGLRANDLYRLTISCDATPGLTADDRIMPYLANLGGLKVLRLERVNVTYKGMQFITALKSLKELSIRSQAVLSGPEAKSRQLGDPCLAYIAGLKSLQTLELASHDITDAGLVYLSRLPALRELRLWSSEIRGPGLAYLSAIPSLESLSFFGPRISDARLEYLRNITSLRKLNLAGLQITGTGLVHLWGLTKLEELDLFNTLVTDRRLVHLKPLRSLKKLNVRKRPENKTRVTDKGMPYLAEIKSLEYLELPNTGITDKGLAHVGELGRLKYLWVCGSGDSPITDRGIRHIARLGSLERLHIGGTGITDTGMSYIARLTNLKELSLFTAPEVTNTGLARLRSLQSLQKLSLGYGTKITISGLAHLNALPDLTSLRARGIGRDNFRLNIGGLTRLEKLSLILAKDDELRDEDLACLAKLAQLNELQLGPHDSRISDAGFRHLAGLTSLELLNVGGRYLTDDGLRYLANMHRLWHLTLTGDLTERGLRHLEGLKALGYLTIASKRHFSSEAMERLKRRLPDLGFFKVEKPAS